MKIRIALIIVFFLFVNVVVGQNSLLVTNPSVYLVDTSASFSLRLGAEINDISQADTVWFLLGTSSGSADVLEISSPVVMLGGSYFIQYNGHDYPIHGNQVTVSADITSKKYNVLQYLTVNAKDRLGNITQPIVIQIQ